MLNRVAQCDEEAGIDCRPANDDVLCSPASEARFLVIDPGAADNMPSLDGIALIRGKRLACSSPTAGAPDPALRGGQRYVDAITGLTLLCIHPGDGALCFEGRRLTPEDIRRRSIERIGSA